MAFTPGLPVRLPPATKSVLRVLTDGPFPAHSSPEYTGVYNRHTVTGQWPLLGTGLAEQAIKGQGSCFQGPAGEVSGGLKWDLHCQVAAARVPSCCYKEKSFLNGTGLARETVVQIMKLSLVLHTMKQGRRDQREGLLCNHEIGECVVSGMIT